MDSEIKCPGCGETITAENAGGYRTYCLICVDAMPPIPGGVDEHGYAKDYNITGKYPNFEWVGA